MQGANDITNLMCKTYKTFCIVKLNLKIFIDADKKYLHACISFRFAIDWNDEEQVVRLMLGKAGQIVCTLKVENEYPTNGDVSVEEIHGADPAIIFQDSLVSD